MICSRRIPSSLTPEYCLRDGSSWDLVLTLREERYCTSQGSDDYEILGATTMSLTQSKTISRSLTQRCKIQLGESSANLLDLHTTLAETARTMCQGVL